MRKKKKDNNSDNKFCNDKRTKIYFSMFSLTIREFENGEMAQKVFARLL